MTSQLKRILHFTGATSGDASMKPRSDSFDPGRKLEDFLDSALEGMEYISVLEAGCGSDSNHLRLRPRVRLTGIDLSEDLLRRNTALQERIQGDVQHYNFPQSSFDVIICWTVLEHLPQPQLALDKFDRALKPGGLMVLVLPNVWSVKGLCTKLLPMVFHVWYIRYIFGEKDVVDGGPFKTTAVQNN